MISILFFIKRHRLLRTGQAPIYVRVSANRAYSEFGIGRGVDQEQWVTARGRVKPVGSKNKALNAYLDKIEYDLFSIAQTLQSEGKQVTAKAVTTVTEVLTNHRFHSLTYAKNTTGCNRNS